MNIVSWVILAVIAVCAAAALRSVVRAKKKGQCVGCSASGDCPHCGSGCQDSH